jgi:hypothetical protein
MTKSKNIQEADLKPYQTHLLFQSDVPLTANRLQQLLRDVASLVVDEVQEEGENGEILEESHPRLIKEEYLGWFTFRKTNTVQWARGADAPRDIEHHLVVLTARTSFLSVVSSDKSLGARLSRFKSKHWSNISQVPVAQLEKTLITGPTRTLWLSGIHRSVATKPDSKILIGSDIEATLDALGDQSYQYTSTRCKAPISLPTSFVGVTPRSAKVWFGPSGDWELFLANTQLLLKLMDGNTTQRATPYPVLARAQDSLKNVKAAFDVSLVPPEYLYDEDPDLIARLETILNEATWTVKAQTGPNCLLLVRLPDGEHELEVEIKSVGNEIQHSVRPVEKDPSEKVKQIVDLCNRQDLLKIFYDSLHTYADGRIFEIKTRPFAFPLSPAEFSHYEVDLEKPRAVGKKGDDLSRIGEPGEPSLFSWVWDHYKKGWLWCDDRSGEFADFIHLDTNRSELSLIHVKGANSKSSKRGISVSAYEVVCSQALKNLRYTERSELEKPLKKKLGTRSKFVRGWHNGKPLAPYSLAIWKAIEDIPYSQLNRRVVIVQPHVRICQLPANLSSNSSAVRQAHLLYTLLHGVKSDMNRYGVDFEVIVDK